MTVAIGRPIEGPFEFGDRPPERLMGWVGPAVAEAEYSKLYDRNMHTFPGCKSFQDATGKVLSEYEYTEDIDPAEHKYIWEFAKQVNGGQHIPCEHQQGPNCVASAIVTVTNYRTAYEIAVKAEEEELHRAYSPYTYGMSRVYVGNNRLGLGGGSTGSWGAAAARLYGTLYIDETEHEVPAETSRIVSLWGRRPGPPQWAIDLAKDNLVKKTARIHTVEEVRRELLAYRPVTIASSQGWKMRPVRWSHGGVDYHVMVPSGRFDHQTALLDWNEDAGLLYRQNSWGARAHGTPFNGEPPGGMWMHIDDLENELRRFRCELFAFSGVDGWPAKPNPSIL